MALASIGLIGNGITRMVTFGSTVKEICSSDGDCDVEEVCCLFFGEKSGVCHDREMCSSIRKITRKEKEKSRESRVIAAAQDDKGIQKDNFFMQTLLVILILGVLWFYIRHSNLLQKTPKRKRRAARS